MSFFFQHNHTAMQPSHLLGRRAFLGFAVTGLCQLLRPFPLAAFQRDRAFLNTILSTPDSYNSPDKPLLIFRGFVQDFDPEVEMRLYHEIAGQQDLIERLRQRIQFGSRLSMKIDSIKTQLLFIPELRENFAAAYRTYCQEAVEFTCNRLNHPRIYRDIISLTRGFPKISTGAVTAYLVHRLIKEYVATCTFSGEKGASVSYNISGSFVSSQLGAVDLEIVSPQPGIFSLKRKPYSIWQNDTANQFNLLALPIEESLHFIVGKTTDKHIAAKLLRGKDLTVSAVQQVADHWIAIEEAVVGGILHRLMKDFVNKNEIPLSSEAFDSSISKKGQLARYKYRARGVAVVKKFGVEETLHHYESNPEILISLLTKD